MTELRDVDVPVGAPPGGRRPLRELDATTRAAIGSAGGVVDGAAALAAWDHVLQAPAWDGAPVWIDSDLLRPSLLVRAATRGFARSSTSEGSASATAPTDEVIAAWSVFASPGRARGFVRRSAWTTAPGTRARGFALHQAAMIIPYHRVTNPGFVALAKRTVEQVLLDIEP